MVFYSKNKSGLAYIFGLLLLFSACKKEVEKEQKQEELIVYQPSEMAILMNAFYEYNASLKSAIINNETLQAMPESFQNIHSAKMSDPDGRNAIFNGLAPVYITAQMRVLDSLSSLDVKSRYNNAINLCIACHKTECVGPIPRIKKLLIP